MRPLQKQEEAWFVQFVQNLPAPAWAKDADGRYVFVNPAAATAFGRIEEEIIGKNDHELFDPNTAESFRRNDKLALEKGSSFEAIEVLRDRHGKHRYSLVTKFPVQMMNGRTLVAGTAVDITDQRVAFGHNEFLFEISEKIRLATSAEELLNDIAKTIGAFLEVDRCLFNEIELDRDLETIRSEFTRTDTSVIGQHKVSSYSAETTRLIKEGRTIVNRDSKVDDRTSALYGSVYGPAGERSYVAVPMMRDGRWVASLWCSCKEPRDWTEQEVILIETVAERAWTAIERLRVEAALKKVATEKQEAHDALQAVYDQSPVGLLQLDRDLRYTRVNEKLAAMNGISADEHIGKTIFEIVPDLSPKLAESFLKVIATGEPMIDVELSGSTAADPGRVHTWLESWWPIRDADGEIVGINVSAHDITDRKRSSELLQTSEGKMRALTESFTDFAILSTDVDGMIQSWNPGAECTFGYLEAEILGKSIEILFTPEDAANRVPAQEMRRAREAGRASDERWHLRKDGSRFFASGVMVPLFADEVLYGYAKIARDLTEKTKQAEDLQNAYEEMENRVLERTRELIITNQNLQEQIEERRSVERQRIGLLHRIVTSQEDERRRIARDLHDQLGQRLTALRLKLASLSDACSANPELYERTNRLQQIAESLDSEVGFLAWEIRPSALDELGLIAALEAYILEWSRHYGMPADFQVAGIQDVSLSSEVETQIYRITQEALNNVIKHSSARRASIIFEKVENGLVLILEDDGVGFDPESLEPGKRESGGLGLPGMKERAELIGGEIELESSEGMGTTIYLRIPMTEKSHEEGKHE